MAEVHITGVKCSHLLQISYPLLKYTEQGNSITSHSYVNTEPAWPVTKQAKQYLCRACFCSVCILRVLEMYFFLTRFLG